MSSQDGLSLIEVMIAMTLLLVILGGIYTVWSGLERSYAFTDEDLTAQTQARAAMGEMVEYVRTARLPETAPTEALRMVIPAADANSLTLWTDTDRDANHDLELIRFRVDTATGTLYRDEDSNEDGSFSTGATHVRLVTDRVTNDADNPLFVYVDGSGAELPSPVADTTKIREIRIHLRVDIDPSRSPIVHELTSVVQPRNLRQY